ncbi:MAG: bifunctional diaminohydroxyphosphoribosylaminopyrimidine deaminase/5-amino-6-(5-phosphoribosylamino)uracil reductase RibD [Flavobacteriaceae bacterium]
MQINQKGSTNSLVYFCDWKVRQFFILDWTPYMQRCLTLAAKGLGNTYPNPMVGAVVVYNGKIIGEGWHQKAGEAHAEVHAIQAVKDKSKLVHSTLVVSLEPCSHYGKTPPCSKLIAESGIRHVVIGMMDPFEAVQGRGIQHLKDSGVKVEIGVLESECRSLNKRFLNTVEKKRPYIILKWAQSEDGFIAPNNQKKGQPHWITEPPARQLVHKWRAEEQAILVGRKTVEMDNPALDVRLWSGNTPTRLIIDPSCSINADTLKTNNTTYIYNNVKEGQQKNIHYIRIDFDQKPLQQIMKHIFESGFQSVLVEGGAQTLQHFIDAELWDESRVLTGEKKLNKGMRAPKLKVPAKPLRNFECSVDKVEIFMNS